MVLNMIMVLSIRLVIASCDLFRMLISIIFHMSDCFTELPLIVGQLSTNIFSQLDKIIIITTK